MKKMFLLVVFLLTAIFYNSCAFFNEMGTNFKNNLSGEEPSPDKRVGISSTHRDGNSMVIFFDRLSNGQYFFDITYKSSIKPEMYTLILTIDNSSVNTISGNNISYSSGYENVQFIISDQITRQILNCNNRISWEIRTRKQIPEFHTKGSIAASDVINRVKIFINYWEKNKK